MKVKKASEYLESSWQEKGGIKSKKIENKSFELGIWSFWPGEIEFEPKEEIQNYKQDWLLKS